MSKDIHKKKHLSSFQLIILGFAGVILLGGNYINAASFFCRRSDNSI